MARLKEDGKFQVEGSVKMWLPVVAEEGERVQVNSARDVLPEQVWINVNQENGDWVVGTASVKGRVYRKDGSVGERWDERMYSGPHDDGFFEGPAWLVDLIDREVPRRLSGRTKAPENAAAARVEREAVRPVDRARERFEGALNALLTRENLQGSQWAIRRLTEEADAFPDNSIAEIMRGIARQMSVDLDKRAAELAMREH